MIPCGIVSTLRAPSLAYCHQNSTTTPAIKLSACLPLHLRETLILIFVTRALVQSPADYGVFALMVYSHSLFPGPEEAWPRKNGLYGFRKNLSHCTKQARDLAGTGNNGLCIHFQVLKLFQMVYFNYISMAFRCPVLAPYTASGNGFCIIPVPVPVPVSDTASVNTP